MKNKDYLTVRQEELMNFLWKVNEPNCIKVFERNCKYTSELESPRSFGYGF